MYVFSPRPKPIYWRGNRQRFCGVVDITSTSHTHKAARWNLVRTYFLARCIGRCRHAVSSTPTLNVRWWLQAAFDRLRRPNVDTWRTHHFPIVLVSVDDKWINMFPCRTQIWTLSIHLATKPVPRARQGCVLTPSKSAPSVVYIAHANSG